MKLIPLVQILVSIALIILILLQERTSGLSGLFGGDSGGVYQTRRGVERIIFRGTIGLAVLFVLLAVSQLIFR